MTTEELLKVQRIFPQVRPNDPFECPKCQWKGVLQDLEVFCGMTTRPRILACPQCGEYLVHTAPHVW